MTNDEMITQIVETGIAMRAVQVKYFRTRDKSVISESKRLESKLDALHIMWRNKADQEQAELELGYTLADKSYKCGDMVTIKGGTKSYSGVHEIHSIEGNITMYRLKNLATGDVHLSLFTESVLSPSA